MGYKSIHIENFTVFKNIDIEFCEGVNIIIGDNGTGKTHLLEWLYADNRSYGEVDKAAHYRIFGVSDKDYWLEVIKKTKIDYDSYDKLATYSLFIPAKDMISHAQGLIPMSKRYSKSMPFDYTLLDIIEAAQRWRTDEIPQVAKNITPKLEKLINGTVFVNDDNSFWIKKNDGRCVKSCVNRYTINPPWRKLK